MKTRLLRQVELLRAAFAEWSADQVSRLAAALAFYTALSLAPLLIFLVALISLVLSGPSVQQTLLEFAESALGASGRELVQTILRNRPSPGSGLLASGISVTMLLFSASTLFNELQHAFNIIWRAPREQLRGVGAVVLLRARALIMVFGIGGVLLLTLLLTLAVRALERVLQTFSEEQIGPLAARILPGVEVADVAWLVNRGLPIIDWSVSLVVLWLLFTWMFRSMPHRMRIRWGDVWGGALLTAVLFALGKFALAFYLSTGSVGSAYGAAGSLLVVLVWVYYSAQIVFLGAEYTYVYTHRYGSRRPQPAPPAPLPVVEQPAPAIAPSAVSRPALALFAFLVFLVGLLIGGRDARR